MNPRRKYPALILSLALPIVTGTSLTGQPPRATAEPPQDHSKATESTLEPPERLEVIGAYNYTYGDGENLVEARRAACRMAARSAIESYQMFVGSTSTVKNNDLIEDLIETISSGYLEDTQIVEQAEVGRTVHCKVNAFVVPEVLKVAMDRQLGPPGKKEGRGTTENAFISVLSVKETPLNDWGSKSVRVIYRQKGAESLDFTRQTDVMIDFFDVEGNPLSGTNTVHCPACVPEKFARLLSTCRTAPNPIESGCQSENALPAYTTDDFTLEGRYIRPRHASRPTRSGISFDTIVQVGC